ncbi:MAG: alpha/beta fold hydrolase [Rhodospirillaceae bacterium]|nr:alpha/beta fold hydrolase [Rhodospirillaceae bacterium]
MAKTARAFRVIDTGLRDARANIAFDQALIDARLAGSIPNTMRFLRFPPSALIGVHQVLPHEVRLAYCHQQGIQVARRITGGGALFMDERQLGWELVFDRSLFRGSRPGAASLANISARICKAAAAGLGRLGIAAEFRPRNDIEVAGRKLGGTGGIHDGQILFFQGTLLIDFDPSRMIAALKTPAHKLARRDLTEAHERVVCLAELLPGALPDTAVIQQALLAGFAEHLDIAPYPGEITMEEETLANELLRDEIGRDDFVDGIAVPESGETHLSATLNLDGGAIRADIRVPDARRARIQDILLSGDFFITPPRAVFDLEARLRGAARGEVSDIITRMFDEGAVECLELAPADFCRTVDMAFRQLSIDSGGKVLRGHLIGGPARDRPTLVFLHDALGCTRFWRGFCHRLSERTGLPALVYDRLGAGYSDPLEQPFEKLYMADEALRSLPDVLRAGGIEDAILIGHSDGGTIALTYAGAAPDQIRAVIAIAPHLYREARTLDAVRERIEEFETGDLKARLARYHGAKTEVLFQRLVTSWTAADAPDWGVEPYVSKVRCPVFAIQGAEDEYFSAAQLDAIEAIVKGGFERLIIDECGHVPQHSATDEVLDAMAEFINRIQTK